MPFTLEQFLHVFREYNESIWPAQPLLFLLGILAIISALRRMRFSPWILAALWVFCGIAYHWVHFSRVNPAAWIFGTLFLAAALFILKDRGTLESQKVPPLRRAMGIVVVFYALFLYPAAGYLAGHLYPAAPTFGAPCPLAIFTIGVFMIGARPLPMRAAFVPVLWSLVALPAITRFGMLEDLGLPVASAVFAAFVVGERIKPLPVSRTFPAAPHPSA